MKKLFVAYLMILSWNLLRVIEHNDGKPGGIADNLARSVECYCCTNLFSHRERENVFDTIYSDMMIR